MNSESDRMVQLVIAEIVRLCHPTRPVHGMTMLEEIPDLDSIRMVELVLGVERSLGCEVDYARLDRLTDVSDLATAFLN